MALSPLAGQSFYFIFNKDFCVVKIRSAEAKIQIGFLQIAHCIQNIYLSLAFELRAKDIFSFQFSNIHSNLNLYDIREFKDL